MAIRIENVETGKENPFAAKNVDVTRRKIIAYETLGREVKTMLRPDVPHATIDLKGVTGAMRILIVSDLHAFHAASSLEKINEIWAEINKPDTFVIFAGDIIEGIKQEYLSSSTSTLLSMQEQIDAFKELWLKPLVEKGKVLAMVSRFGSHDDWPQDKTTINAVSLLLNGLQLPNSQPVPLIWNGGQLNLHLVESDLTFQIGLNHMVAGSGSALNPVKPLRNQIVVKKIPRGETQPKSEVAGHQHTLAGVSSERVLAGPNEIQLILCQNGTLKGVENDNPDFFMQTKGSANKPQLAGAAMVLRVNNHRSPVRELQVIPTYGMNRSSYLHSAMEVLNRTEQQNITDELIRRIVKKNGPIITRFDKKSPSAERLGDKIKSPLYKELDWRVDTGPLNLPLTVYTISHARTGTSQMDINHVQEILTEVEKAPNATILILGDMVDLSVPNKSDRLNILADFAKEMSRVSQEKRLGAMLSSVFLSDRWNKEISEGGDVISKKIITGDYLYYKSGIRGTPLYEGGASMKITVGGQDYWWYILDGTGNFGSRKDPYLALIQMDSLNMVRSDVITGGLATIPGAFTNDTKIMISPGWESPAVDRRHGKSFSQRAPKGGQGVIMFPENGTTSKMIFAGGSFRETRDMSNGFLLWRGLDRMRELKKVTSRRNK